MSNRTALEVKQTLRLAGPLIVGHVSGVAMSFTDTLMAGRLSSLDLASVAVGASFWTGVYLLISGAMMAVPAFVAQFDGANRRDKIAPFIWQAMWGGVLVALVMWTLSSQVGLLASNIGIDETILPIAVSYVRAISWGLPALSAFFLFRFLSEGLSLTRPTMYFGVLGALVNIPANYVLMYGAFGIEGMGAVGCAYASAVVLWVQAVAIVTWVMVGRSYADLGLFRRFTPPDPKQIFDVLRVGLPIGITIFLEAGLFVSTTLMVSTLGTMQVAGHQIALNFSALLFMVPLGLAGALTIRVGNSLGRDDMAQARFRGLTGLGMTVVTQTLSLIIVLTLPVWIAGIYTSDPAVAAIAINLLAYAAVFQLPDGIQVAALGALRGMKDTKWPMLITFIAYWAVGFALSYNLGIRLEHGAPGIWSGLIGGLTVAAVLLTWRFWLISKPPAASPSR